MRDDDSVPGGNAAIALSDHLKRHAWRIIILAGVCFFAVSAASCVFPADPCTSDLQYHSLTVHIRDARTGDAIASGATVTVGGTAGTEVFTFPSQASADSGAYLSKATTPGTFSVRVIRPGYAEWSQSIEVKSDQCGRPVQAVVRAALTQL